MMVDRKLISSFLIKIDLKSPRYFFKKMNPDVLFDLINTRGGNLFTAEHYVHFKAAIYLLLMLISLCVTLN